MFLVAGEAAQALMDSDGRSVIPGRDLSVSIGRVALVAEGLALVGTDLYRARAFEHVWKRKTIQRDVVLLAAVEKG